MPSKWLIYLFFVCVSLDFHLNLQICCFYSLGSVSFYKPMDYRLPSSSVRGTSQARILDWVVISFSRGSSYVYSIGRRILYHRYQRSLNLQVYILKMSSTWKFYLLILDKWNSAQFFIVRLRFLSGRHLQNY